MSNEFSWCKTVEELPPVGRDVFVGLWLHDEGYFAYMDVARRAADGDKFKCRVTGEPLDGVIFESIVNGKPMTSVNVWSLIPDGPTLETKA